MGRSGGVPTGFPLFRVSACVFHTVFLFLLACCADARAFSSVFFVFLYRTIASRQGIKKWFCMPNVSLN
jgi:hypothetical protein